MSLNKQDFSKLAINAMIGCFNPKVRENWKTVAITTNTSEAFEMYLQAKGAFIDTRPIGGTQYHQVYEEYFTNRDETEAPLYNMIIDMEAVELHKLATEIWNKGGLVHHLNTDECTCSFPRDDKCPFPLIEGSINLDGYFYDEKMDVPKYKLVEKVDGPKLKIERMPAHIRNETYKHKDIQWTISGDVLDNNVQPLVERILDSGKSYNIDGMAGTGKSTLIKKLKEDGQERVKPQVPSTNQQSSQNN